MTKKPSFKVINVVIQVFLFFHFSSVFLSIKICSYRSNRSKNQELSWSFAPPPPPLPLHTFLRERLLRNSIFHLKTAQSVKAIPGYRNEKLVWNRLVKIPLKIVTVKFHQQLRQRSLLISAKCSIQQIYKLISLHSISLIIHIQNEFEIQHEPIKCLTC